MPYFPLASGLLTGKYTPADGNKFQQFSAKQYATIMNALEQVKEIAVAHQATIAQTILAWYIKDPDISVVIPGARLADQVHSNAKALTVQLSDAEFNQIDQLFKSF